MVYLVGHGTVQIESQGLASAQVRHRVRPGRNGLGLQRLDAVFLELADFRGDDPTQVVLYVEIFTTVNLPFLFETTSIDPRYSRSAALIRPSLPSAFTSIGPV